MSSILDDFEKLSNVRIGSFGKFIFNNSILKASNNRKLERKHSNFAGFVLNGVNTGVKTTRKDLFNRIKELKETGANIFISACPLCELGLAYGIGETEKEKYKILDISELLIKLL